MESNRGKQLAERSDTGEEAQDSLAQEHQYLTFRLNKEMYAFGILNVKEILEYGKVTQVPMMPDYIQGVINLRGEVVPVINLARRFHLSASSVTKRTCVIIVEVTTDSQTQDLGVMVDSVSEVLDIQPADIRPAPGFGTRISTDFIKGMGKIEDDFVIILNEERVLSVEELTMVSQMKDLVEAQSQERED